MAYVRQYPQFILGYVVSVLLMALFSSISIALLDPVLKLLFTGEGAPTEGAVNVSLNIHNIKETAYYFVNDIIKAEGRNQALMTFIFIIVGLNILGNIFRYTSNASSALLRTASIYDLRKDVMSKIVDKNIAFIDKQRKGDLIARITMDVDEVDRSIVSSLNAIIKNPVQIALYLTFMLQYSATLTGVIFIVLPVSAVFISVIGRSLKKNAHDGQKAMSSMIGVIEEGLGGMRVVKAFGSESYLKKVFDNFNSAYKRLFRTQLLKMFLASPFSETSGVIAVGFILWYGGGLVFEGKLEASGFMAYIFIFTQTLQPAKELSNGISRIFKGIASGERIFSLMDQKVEVKDAPNATEIQEFNSGISFKNVEFKYEKDPVLKGVSFEIKKGGFYALVGPSGCGKSTSIELLMRFYDPQNGEIIIDGHDIKSVTAKSLREQMAIVTQDPILFNDSIFNNIAFGNENASAELVEEAAKIANAHEFILELPNGYQTEIGDRGVLLSGGQRQRISIARAVLKGAPILLLDEATSALDAESEREVQKALDGLMKSKTSLVVAHRLSTIQHADCILVMNKGEIVEQGTHSELIANKGLYWKLSQIQQLNA
jgi:subfamily B ATP-binding cassette protein MsbA